MAWGENYLQNEGHIFKVFLYVIEINDWSTDDIITTEDDGGTGLEFIYGGGELVCTEGDEICRYQDEKLEIVNKETNYPYLLRDEECKCGFCATEVYDDNTYWNK